MKVVRIPPSSRAAIPAIEVPPGELTMSFRAPGWRPVSIRSLAAPGSGRADGMSGVRSGRRGGAPPQHGLDDRGLPRQDDDGRVPDQLRVVGGNLDAVLPVELLEALEAHVGRADGRGRHEVRRQESLDHRLTHVAGTDEPDLLAFDRHRSRGSFGGPAARGPKIAVPTRTIVAPSSIATSKSPLIPIDNSRSPWRSPSFASVRNQTRVPAGSGASGGIAISPSTLTWSSFATLSSSSSSPSGATPPFDGSRATFTWTRASTGRPPCWARLSSSHASSARSTEWIRSKSSAASLALFVCGCDGPGGTSRGAPGDRRCTGGGSRHAPDRRPPPGATPRWRTRGPA